MPFTEYVPVNVALESKELDANAIQHYPYLAEQSKDRGWTDLVVVGNTFVNFEQRNYDYAALERALLKGGSG